MEPSIIPPKQIADEKDKKPDDWDDRPQIEDPDAKKPDDWDESQPKEIEDADAVKPDDWLEEEDPFTPDPEAQKPNDWDEEVRALNKKMFIRNYFNSLRWMANGRLGKFQIPSVRIALDVANGNDR